MKSDSKLPDQFTYKIKQNLYQIGSNTYSVEYYDSLGVYLITLVMTIPHNAEESWIKQKVNELYTRFAT